MYALQSVTDLRHRQRFTARKLCGYLKPVEAEEPLNCELRDVSMAGMGIVSPTPLAKGDLIKLGYKRIKVTLRVAWSKPCPADAAGVPYYRYGLRIEQGYVDFMKYFVQCYYRRKK